MDTIKTTKILGLALIIVGVGALAGASIMTQPPTTVEKVGEFNQSYAESRTPSSAFGGYNGENISAGDVHTVYNATELNNETLGAIQEAREQGISSVQGPEQEIIGGRFIVLFDGGEQIVFSASSSGITKGQSTLAGLLSLFAGLLILSILRGDKQLPDKVKRASEDSRWDYDVENGS